jgi:hypothetical protein
VLGGAAAVIIFLALQLFAPDVPLVAYGAIAFLTGSSEPFFNRMLQGHYGDGTKDWRLVKVVGCQISSKKFRHQPSTASAPFGT